MSHRLEVFVCHDPDGHDEEACTMLIASSSPRAAERYWRYELGIGVNDARCDVRPAEWQWGIGGIREPRPKKAGVWWPREWTPQGRQYHGFGLWGDSDPACDECGDHVDSEDTVSVVEGDVCFRVCVWCASKDLSSSALVRPDAERRGLLTD